MQLNFYGTIHIIWVDLHEVLQHVCDAIDILRPELRHGIFPFSVCSLLRLNPHSAGNVQVHLHNLTEYCI